MSRLRANQITNKTANGAPTATNGLTVTGVCTATSFSGNGAGLVGVASTDNINTSTNAVLSGIVTAGTLSVSGNATVTGNLGVGGVLTYEDVTNIDSVGVITARAGINVSGGTITGDGSGLTGVGLGTDGSANTSGIITATAFVPTTGQLSHRNIIVNGAMNVAQRGTSSASADFASVDRMKMSVTNIDQLAFLQKQTSDGPDGFSNCFEFDVTTVENALDADDLVYMRYAVEAQDLIPFFNANGSGKNFTLSFYVKAYQTGTYQVGIYKADATAQFITRTYTIASSGVWQRVVLNFTGDTGTSGINADNGLGFQISFMLAAGTNYTSGSEQPTWGGWPGNPGFAAGHAVNTLSSTDNYWRITGIQLELGDVATPFEHKNFREQLSDCQRYFFNIKGNNDAFMGIAAFANSSSVARFAIYFPVPMRTNPTYSGSGNLIFDSSNDSASFAASSCTIINGTSSYILSTGGVSSVCLQSPGTSGMSGNSGGGMIMRSNPTTLNFDAEM